MDYNFDNVTGMFVQCDVFTLPFLSVYDRVDYESDYRLCFLFDMIQTGRYYKGGEASTQALICLIAI